MFAIIYAQRNSVAKYLMFHQVKAIIVIIAVLIKI